MKEYLYEFNKSVSEVITDINKSIEEDYFEGYTDGCHIELRTICEGYDLPTHYRLIADITNSASGKCVLKGTFGYSRRWLISTLTVVIFMTGFSSFMAVAYSNSIGKYLIVFSVIVFFSYMLMAFFKRKSVIAQTEEIFNKINKNQL